MKKILYTFALMVLCLSFMTVSASAMVQYNSYNTGASGCPSYNMVPSSGAYGCGTVAPPMPSQSPGYSTQFCTKWIAGHWVQVRVMMPGRWVYKPVWIPSYPVTRNKWVPGFWQTTGTNVRPDLQIWGSPHTGWYGRPYQQQTGGTGGYFSPQGMWIPAQ